MVAADMAHLAELGMKVEMADLTQVLGTAVVRKVGYPQMEAVGTEVAPGKALVLAAIPSGVAGRAARRKAVLGLEK